VRRRRWLRGGPRLHRAAMHSDLLRALQHVRRRRRVRPRPERRPSLPVAPRLRAPADLRLRDPEPVPDGHSMRLRRRRGRARLRPRGHRRRGSVLREHAVRDGPGLRRGRLASALRDALHAQHPRRAMPRNGALPRAPRPPRHLGRRLLRARALSAPAPLTVAVRGRPWPALERGVARDFAPRHTGTGLA
jgi:hypothetical protein